MNPLRFFLAFVAVVSTCNAFTPIAKQKSRSSLTNGIAMAPKYNGDKWVPTSPDEEPSAGYGVTKTVRLNSKKVGIQMQ